MAKKYKYSFTRKNEAKGGKRKRWCLPESLSLLSVLIIVSFAFSGNGGTVLGAVGLCAMILAVYGFGILGLKGLSERNAGHRHATIGTLAAGGMSILWLALFLAGVK